MKNAWSKDDPAWTDGTKDTILAEYEDRETVRLVSTAVLATQPNPLVLDIGAGSGLHSRRVFPNDRDTTRLDIVPSPDDGIFEGDALNLRGHRDGQYDLVHARRVVSNLDPIDRPRGLAELWRVLRSGGHLFVVDVFNPHHARVNEVRAGLGLPPLGGQYHGQGFLDLATLSGVLKTQPLYSRPIAADYYLWTRAWAPAFRRAAGLSPDVPWADEALRRAFPILDRHSEDYFGVHRVIVWRKP